MNRFARPMLALAASITVFAAQSAAADDGRRHVMTPTQKIDLVRDLPNDATFERDGQYFDLGYIYPIHTVNGASVASAGGDAGFVLYHDDRYARLDARDIDELRFVLGEDPTEGFTPPVSPSSARAVGDPSDAWPSRPSRPDTPDAVPYRASTRRTGGLSVGGFFLVLLVLIIRFRALREMVFGGLMGLAFHRRRTASQPVATDFGDPFEARVASRLAELQDGGVAPAPSSYQPPSAPAVRGFGRKGA
jgi:hypothetical protein